jgi:hypothetical protein
LKQGRFFIIVDLGNVDYISSAGWGIFISEIKSIRENDGDLKLVKMVPDVYEIFELLEFHHILDVYDTIDEAVNKFEMLEAAGKSVAKEITLPKSEPVAQPAAPQPAADGDAEQGAQEKMEDKAVDPASLSINEKIRTIVKTDPILGALKIKRILNSATYGYAKLGWFDVRSKLVELNLNSKVKRFEFANKN